MSKDKGVISFPQSKVPGRNKNRPAKELGNTKLLDALDDKPGLAKGHWCSKCEGVWYGLKTEAECPICGNRQG